MAVKILITLEGTEQINTALDAMSAKGEEFMKTFQSLGTEKSPLGDVAVQLQTASAHAGEGIATATEATHGFTEALRVLIPGLRLAGVEVGNFAGFARLATAGIGGLAVAIAGAVVIALANLEERAAQTKAALSGLFGSQELGANAFAAIQESAANLETTVGALAPIFQAATTALQRFVQTQQGFKFVALKSIDLPTGLAGNIKTTTDAITSLIKIIRASGQDEATAEKSAAAFFNTMKEGGKLTADALKQMDPGAVRLLAEALGRGAISSEQFIAEVGLAPVPINRVMEALQRFGAGADQAFNTTAVKSFKDELQGLLNDFQTGFKGVTGISFSGFVISELEKIRSRLRGTTEEIKIFRDFLRQIEGATATGITLPEFGVKAPAAGTAPALPESFKSLPEDAKKTIDETNNVITAGLEQLVADIAASPFAKSIQGPIFAFLDSLPAHVQSALINIPLFFNEIKANFVSTFSNLSEIATSILPRVQAAITGIAPAISGIWDSIITDARSAGNGIADAFNTIVNAISGIWGGIGSAAAAAWRSIVDALNSAVSAMKTAWNDFLAIFTRGINASGITAAWSATVAAFILTIDTLMTAWNGLVSILATPVDLSGLSAAWSGFVDAFNAAVALVTSGWGGLVTLFTTPIDFTSLFSSFQSAIDSLVSIAQSVYNSIVSIFSNPINAIFNSSGGGAFASGGLVTGPGTGTSDSILAWLSNKEFVLNAKATSFYGPDLLHALNSMRIPRDVFPGFNMGGLVAAMAGSMPRLATGGQAVGTPVTFVIDRQRFNVTATEDTVKALSRFAVNSQLSSAGRKPSWVR